MKGRSLGWAPFKIADGQRVQLHLPQWAGTRRVCASSCFILLLRTLPLRKMQSSIIILPLQKNGRFVMELLVFVMEVSWWNFAMEVSWWNFTMEVSWWNFAKEVSWWNFAMEGMRLYGRKCCITLFRVIYVAKHDWRVRSGPIHPYSKSLVTGRGRRGCDHTSANLKGTYPSNCMTVV